MLDNTPRLEDDQDLRAIVLKALAAEARFAGLRLRVGIHNGIVHLSGGAPSLELRNQVEQHIFRIPGIRGIVNRIHAPGAPSPIRTIHLNLSSATEEGENHES